MSVKKAKPLPTLVAIYHREFGPRLLKYLDHFENLDSLDDAIHFACVGKGGNIHGHQRRVGKEILERAIQELLRHADEIKACTSFDTLLACVEKHTNKIYRFGDLAVYDTTLRIGAYRDLWPQVVYLHAGTRKGCKALGLDTSKGVVIMDDLPAETG